MRSLFVETKLLKQHQRFKTMKLGNSTLEDEARNLTEKTKAAAKYTDDYVHENPWLAVGAAVVAGLVVGLLLVPKNR